MVSFQFESDAEAWPHFRLWNKRRRGGCPDADSNPFKIISKERIKSIIGSTPKTNDNLRQSRRPSYLNLHSDGFTSPSVHKIADFKPTFITIKQATRVSANLRRPAPVYENYKSLSCNSIIFQF